VNRAILPPLLLLSACQGAHHVLDPAGPQAGRIARLLLLFLVISSAVYVLVLAAFALAARAGTRRRRADEPVDLSPRSERRLARGVAAAALGTAAILLLYVAASATTGRGLASLPATLDPGTTPLTIRVTGHQWWWEIEYADTAPSRRLVTANELHIPVGRPVKIEGNSSDVIHSFWVPNLHGKRDLIPGRPIEGWIQADTAGAWDGECAEFCGHQHAKMRFVVVAEPADSFAAWYDRQLQPAADPADSSALRGREVFLQSSCPMCHTVAGTPAGSRVGPDLTHLASRSRIAAGTLPNTRGHLAAWVLDPQRIKPGVRMPPNALSSSDLHALLDYLESLR
jgi:cytochrome c oxidase subunit II